MSESKHTPIGKLALACLRDVEGWEHRGGFPEYWRAKTLPKLKASGHLRTEATRYGLMYFLTDTGRDVLAKATRHE